MEIPKFGEDTHIKDLQDFQGRYDGEYWQHYGSELEDVRHVLEHLAKLVGKVATPIEAMEHGMDASLVQIDEEVIPDLLVWAFHLANSRGLRVEELYQKRMEGNINRLHPEENKMPPAATPLKDEHGLPLGY